MKEVQFQKGVCSIVEWVLAVGLLRDEAVEAIVSYCDAILVRVGSLFSFRVHNHRGDTVQEIPLSAQR
jgi:hypothetical protein